ncbi:hypothetical protein CC80DRAFT_116765 [Byssothecium circinans]|uniref:Methyltransferase n=1 Tax=Byssothecium circinans TaxID=147558 RepID=A0A6A5TQY0_9PLEO|nr:hypothetical protein CC80DRAFT_116765 [Byssothecium circinans]
MSVLSSSTSMRFVPDLDIYKKQKPYELWFTPEKGIPRTNVQWQEVTGITVHDMRGADVGFESTGFIWTRHTSKYLPDPLLNSVADESRKSRSELVKSYLEETAELVKAQLGADCVFVEDWRHRINTGKYAVDDGVFNNTSQDRNKTLMPALNAHLDDSAVGAQRRLHRLLSDEEIAKYNLQEYRIRMVNVWRPLVAVVEDSPLALCDIRTVQEEDLLPVDKVHSTHVNEACYIRHNAGQKWYSLADQTPQEPYIFLAWDSKKSGYCPGPPHVSFDNPTASEGATPRESIEVRVVAINRL